jgi:hypothetical protein
MKLCSVSFSLADIRFLIAQLFLLNEKHHGIIVEIDIIANGHGISSWIFVIGVHHQSASSIKMWIVRDQAIRDTTHLKMYRRLGEGA